MAWGAIIGGALGLIGGIAGNKSEKKAADARYEYDISSWNYNFDEANRDYRIGENVISRQNIDDNARYQEQSAVRDYQNKLAIRDFDFSTNTRQFKESERIYGIQLGFNNMAAQNAYEAENRRFEETLTGMAFEQQDMLVKMLQEEGQAQAMGVSGRSAGKAIAASLASYGRNQAIMAESLVSARKENKISLREIATQKYGADLNAQARRMLEPLKAPAPLAPLSMPRATILDPRKPVKPPQPIKGAVPNMFNSVLTGMTSGIGAGSAFK